jgi:hypothetical protein
MQLDPVTKTLLERYGIKEDILGTAAKILRGDPGYREGSGLKKMADLGIGEEPKSTTIPHGWNPAIMLFNLLPRDLQSELVDSMYEDEDVPVGVKLIHWLYKKNLVNFKFDEHDRLSTSVTSGGIVAGAAALMGVQIVASTLVWIANKIYKKYFDKAEKACSQYKGEEKDKCLDLYKAKALMESTKALTRTIKICDKSKNKDKCKKEIQDKIKSNQEKIRSIAQKKR